MRLTKLALIACVLALTATPAFADRAAADACAAKLAPDAKLIYGATVGSVAPGVKLEDVIRAKTRGLVMGGQLTRDQAQTAARAAGGCLMHAL